MEPATEQWESDFKLKPCITEILRTDYCQAGVIMLVDKVLLVTMYQVEDNKAYRLYLSDGEKCIQAVLTPHMHPFVWTGEIREGSYVKLDKYKLAFGKKMLGAGHVAYLAISDIQGIGLRSRYALLPGQFIELPEEKRLPPRSYKMEGMSFTVDGPYAVFTDPAADDSLVDFVSKFDAEGEDQGNSDWPERSTSPVKPTDKLKRKASSSPLSELTPNNISVLENLRKGSNSATDRATVQEGFVTQKKSAPDNLPKSMEFYDKNVNVHQKRCLECAVVHGHMCYCTPCIAGNTMKDISDPVASATLAKTKAQAPTTPQQPLISLSQLVLRACESGIPLKRIRLPLELKPLSSVTGARYTRNFRADYLAVVASVNNKTIKCFGTSLKRDLRIVDPSAGRTVILSVFANALNFTPAVGTVALFRNLRKHEWDHGSLNAYKKDCEGYEWFIPNPVGLSVNGYDVPALKAWWEKRQEGEREMRKEVKSVLGEKKVAPICHDRCVKGVDRKIVDELDSVGFIADVEDI